MGATFYLEPAATLDIDIFVSLRDTPGSSLVMLAAVYDYLTSRRHKTEREYIVIEEWPVQFLPPRDALEEEAVEQAARSKRARRFNPGHASGVG